MSPCTVDTFPTMQAIHATPEQLADQLLSFMTRCGGLSHGNVLNAVLELELTIPQLRVLFSLQQSGRPTALHELASETGLSLAGASRTVDVLARAGFVTRREDEHDRRVKRIALSAAGQATIDRLTASRLEGLRGLAEQLTATERDALAGAIAAVLERTSEEPGLAATEAPVEAVA